MVCEITYTTIVVRNATQVVHRHLSEMERFMALGLRNEARGRLQAANGQVERVSRFVKSSRVGKSVAVQASLAPMSGIVERLRIVTRILLRKRRILELE